MGKSTKWVFKNHTILILARHNFFQFFFLRIVSLLLIGFDIFGLIVIF